MNTKGLLCIFVAAALANAIPDEPPQKDQPLSASFDVKFVEDDGKDDGESKTKNEQEGSSESIKQGEVKPLSGDSDDYSFPSWYIDSVFADIPTDDFGLDPTIAHYSKEFSDALSDMRLYSIFKSIKKLKNIITEIDSNNVNGGMEGVVEYTDDDSKEDDDTEIKVANKFTFDDEPQISDEDAQQLSALKSKSPRRVKRDLGWSDVAFTFDDDDLGNYEINGANIISDQDAARMRNGGYFEFDLDFGDEDDLLSRLRNIYSSRVHNPAPWYADDVTPLWKVQKSSYRPKRGSNQGSMKDYILRLPTLEGMRKRSSLSYEPAFREYRRSYQETLDRARTYRSIDRMARQLADNPRSRRQPNFFKYDDDTDKREYSGYTMPGDPSNNKINFLYQEKPVYTIGIGQNIDKPTGDWDLSFPEYVNSEDQPILFFNELGAKMDEKDSKQKRRLVEYPALPGPYQGYYMEGQLFQKVMDRRRKRGQEVKPVQDKVQIAGPNAWGNFIFIDGKEDLSSLDEFMRNDYPGESWGVDADTQMTDKEAYFRVLDAILNHPAFSSSRKIDK